jgi:hypothetical protein
VSVLCRAFARLQGEMMKTLQIGSAVIFVSQDGYMRIAWVAGVRVSTYILGVSRPSQLQGDSLCSEKAEYNLLFDGERTNDEWHGADRVFIELKHVPKLNQYFKEQFK